MIEAKGLTKVFDSRKRGRVVAVEDLDLRCDAGQIYALLGANGAGKTTLLRMLTTLMAPTAGDALIAGHSVRRAPAEVRRLVGVVSYETGVYERMTPREIGRFFGRLNGQDDAVTERNLGQLLSLLGMTDFADRRCEGFSTGMKQKTVLLRALVTGPTILIFDEPTSGLDVLAAKSMMDHLRMLRAQGKTILFSTHVLWEAEKLADRIGIIDGGRLRVEGSLDELRRDSGEHELEDIFFHLIAKREPRVEAA